MIVYFHRNPITFEIFYVGIGTEKRSKQKSHRNKHWHNYVAKYGHPVIQIVHNSVSKEDACTWEKHYIFLLGKKINGGQLVNIADGGETNSGYKHSVEQKKKFSDQAKIRGTSFLQTKEIREKAALSISKSHKGKFIGKENPNYGNFWTDEMKQKASIRLKEKFSKIPSRKKVYQKLSLENFKAAKLNAISLMIESCGKKVLCTRSGQVFKTIVEAAYSINMKKDTLRHKLNGKSPNETYMIFS
jgi:hypothetical protein